MYRGRFAPSPTGPLHAGSLVAALASWLDARAHGGQWLLRIEDVDTPRCVPGADQFILGQLADCGLHPDAPPVWQSQRSALYQQALETLATGTLAYPCACSRKDIEMAIQHTHTPRPRNSELIYPGTCRTGLQGRAARAWRFFSNFHVPNRPAAPVECAQAASKLIAFKHPDDAAIVRWVDRCLGPQQQDVAAEVGDFVLKRADGLWAYQLAVVVDDGAQGITHVVRGQDLANNTARQILLQRALGLPTPHYLHTPLVLGSNGEKLSKQNGAQAIDSTTPSASLCALHAAAEVLGLTHLTSRDNRGDALAHWIAQWQALPQRQSPPKDPP